MSNVDIFHRIDEEKGVEKDKEWNNSYLMHFWNSQVEDIKDR